MNITSGIGSAAQALNVMSTNSTNGAEQIKQTNNNGDQTAAVQQTDAANLTSTAGVLAQALNGDDVRADKVASLQSAIASGTYNVPASAVAHKLIESMLG
jgi:negative regulator of flagellin synthesis FlgM